MTRKLAYPLYGAIRTGANMYFSTLRTFRNRRASRIFVYTDSRGFSVDHWYCKKNPIGSYVAMLAREFRVEYAICPYKYTTLIDFIYDVRNLDLSRYDAIVLHAGIVDYSPGPRSRADRMRREKLDRIHSLFGRSAERDFSPCEYAVQYEGESTASFYTVDALKHYILPAIGSLGLPLLWIGVNPVLADWSGSYSRGRPRNMNEIVPYQQAVNAHLPSQCLNLLDWTDSKIRERTVDNIHLSKVGMSALHSAVRDRLRGLLR